MGGTMGIHEILVVDDDADVREVLRFALDLHGYLVSQARDGDEALQQLRGARRPAAIVLDLCMPGMDGPAFRAAQVRDPAIAGIPVVVVSGEADGHEQAAALGVCGYLRKPVDMGALLATLQGCCER